MGFIENTPEVANFYLDFEGLFKLWDFEN